MTEKKKYPAYRWVVLLSIFPIVISSQIMWLSLSPVSSLCEKFYGVDSLAVSYFSMSYLIMFIIFSIPSSYIIDKYGFRKSIIIGGSLTAVFGVLRAVFADSFTIALICQFVIAVGQPFLINITTKVAANWFPIEERSTATGILTTAQYIGFTVPMLTSPAIAEKLGIPGMMRVYAVIAVISAVIGITLTREKPEIPVDEDEAIVKGNGTLLSSMRLIFTNGRFIAVMIVAFIGIGVFNTIMTEIESLLAPSGFSTSTAGILGALLTIAGIIGAVIIPTVSDKVGKRKIFFNVATLLAIPFFSIFFFYNKLAGAAIACACAGFLLMGVTPILFQHGSEVAYPVEEGTSLSIINLMGNISGIVFILVFEALGNIGENLVASKLFLVAGLAAMFVILLFMKESKIFTDKYLKDKDINSSNVNKVNV